VPQDHHQPRTEAVGCELDALHERGGDDVARYPDHEQITQALVEDDLDRDARVRAAEDDREGLLALGQLEPSPAVGQVVVAPEFGDEAGVAILQAVEGVRG
jgi:hypothetical protein